MLVISEQDFYQKSQNSFTFYLLSTQKRGPRFKLKPSNANSYKICIAYI